MTNTAALLDAARARLGLTSDNKLAQALGWPQGTISGYRRGARCMDVEQVAEFAAKTGIPVETVLAAAVNDRRTLKSKDGRRIVQHTLPLAAA